MLPFFMVFILRPVEEPINSLLPHPVVEDMGGGGGGGVGSRLVGVSSS